MSVPMNLVYNQERFKDLKQQVLPEEISTDGNPNSLGWNIEIFDPWSKNLCPRPSITDLTVTSAPILAPDPAQFFKSIVPSALARDYCDSKEPCDIGFLSINKLSPNRSAAFFDDKTMKAFVYLNRNMSSQLIGPSDMTQQGYSGYYTAECIVGYLQEFRAGNKSWTELKHQMLVAVRKCHDACKCAITDPRGSFFPSAILHHRILWCDLLCSYLDNKIMIFYPDPGEEKVYGRVMNVTWKDWDDREQLRFTINDLKGNPVQVVIEMENMLDGSSYFEESAYRGILAIP